MTAPPAASPAKRTKQTAGAGIVNVFEESLSVPSSSSPTELRFGFESSLTSVSAAFEESLAAIAKKPEGAFWYLPAESGKNILFFSSVGLDYIVKKKKKETDIFYPEDDDAC